MVPGSWNPWSYSVCIQHRKLQTQRRRGWCTNGNGATEVSTIAEWKVSFIVRKSSDLWVKDNEILGCICAFFFFFARDKLMELGVCIRVIGNFTLLPQDIQKLIAQAMILTKDNKKAFLNVAFAYTGKPAWQYWVWTSANVNSGVKCLHYVLSSWGDGAGCSNSGLWRGARCTAAVGRDTAAAGELPVHQHYPWPRAADPNLRRSQAKWLLTVAGW